MKITCKPGMIFLGSSGLKRTFKEKKYLTPGIIRWQTTDDRGQNKDKGTRWNTLNW